jgi:hypothetical protein
MDIIQQLTGINLCPELANQITVHLDNIDYAMLYFVNKQLQMGLKVVFNIYGMLIICNKAAKLGYVNILKWAKERGCCHRVGVMTVDNAAKHGHINVLSWARENGYYWCAWTCAKAAKGNQLDTLIWLRDNGCPWDTWICNIAANKGNLEILKWVRDNGCPWTNYTRLCAAKLGYTDNYPLDGRQIN